MNNIFIKVFLSVILVLTIVNTFMMSQLYSLLPTNPEYSTQKYADRIENIDNLDEQNIARIEQSIIPGIVSYYNQQNTQGLYEQMGPRTKAVLDIDVFSKQLTMLRKLCGSIGEYSRQSIKNNTFDEYTNKYEFWYNTKCGEEELYLVVNFIGQNDALELAGFAFFTRK